MIIYLLGILTGLVIAVVLLFGAKQYSSQGTQKSRIFPKQKAEIIDTATEIQDAFAEVIKENDEKGIDTIVYE